MPSLRNAFRFLSVSFLTILLVTGLLPEALGPVQTASAQAVNFSQTFINGSTHIITFFITILDFFAWLILWVLHHVLDPQFIFDIGEDGTDGPFLMTLHSIWQFTRDIVNMGFAVGLIGYAIMAIVRADMPNLGEKLKKFVMALVIVNFSWFIPRALFDAGQVMTYTAYQIPSLLSMDGCSLPPGPGETEDRPCMAAVDFRFLRSQTATITDGEDGWKCPLPPLVCVQLKPLSEADTVKTPIRILDGLVANHARLRWLADINLREDIPDTLPASEALERLIGVVIKLIIVLVLHIAILFPLMAMAAAFIIRIPVLWLTMAFMPLVALGYVFESVNDMVKPIQDQFIQAILVPIKVAVPFSVAFMMLNIGAASHVAPSGFGTLEKFPVFSGVSDLWQMLWMCIALFVLWKYSFEALKSDKAGMMGMFTDKIEGFGKQLGEFAYKLPLSMQFIPVPGRTEADGSPARRSPMEFLHAGRNMLQSVNRLGRPPNLSESLGLPRTGGTGATAPAVKTLTESINKSITAPARTNISVRIEEVIKDGSGTAAQQAERLTKALQDIGRTDLTVLQGNTQSNAIQALQAAGVINATQAKTLQDRMNAAGTSGSVITP